MNFIYEPQKFKAKLGKKISDGHCNYCPSPVEWREHPDFSKGVMVDQNLDNHLAVSQDCYKALKAYQEERQTKQIESLPAIKLGAKYQHVKVDELLKIVKSLDDATTVNNVAVLKRLNEIDAKLDGIEKMIEGLMP